MLTGREKQILCAIRENEPIKARQLAKTINVSERTIRNDINSINLKIKNIASILSQTNAGYHLKIFDNDAFFNLLHDPDPIIPSTPDERVDFILKLFLNDDHYFKTEEIADKLYQSVSTISVDLKKVRKVLSRYHLTLETRPKYGMILKGGEQDIRKLKGDLLYKNKKADDNLTKIKEILQKTTAKYEFPISEFAFNNLVIHLLTSVERIKKGRSILFPHDHDPDIQHTLEFVISQNIVTQIEKAFHVQFPPDECTYIAIHLLGKKIQKAGENITIPQKYSELIQKLLCELSQEYHIAFEKDLNLQLALSLHLIPLSYRLEYNLRMENPLLDSIKSNYPYSYIIARSLAHGLSNAFKTQLSPDEIGYLALHINLSIDKDFQKIRKKNILIVCATGRGTSKLLEYQYRQRFGRWIDQLISCDVSDLRNHNFEDIDFIFTTVPIPYSVPVPIIEVGFILDQNEAIYIESNIENSVSLSPYFPQELFFCDMDLESPKEIISFLTKKASALFHLPSDFEQLVWKRENLFSTAFNNHVALPHPYRVCTENTFVCTLLLKNPILWSDKQVQIVFLISLSNQNHPNNQLLYRKLSKLLVNDTLLNTLLKKATYESLITILNSIQL